MQLNWMKCQGDVWCKLNTVNLAHQHFDNMDGVYIIWHGGENAATVKVGQGNIRARLQDHRVDPSIQAYNDLGLFVTWAKVPSHQKDGVEAYLGEKLNPKVGDRFPDVEPIAVNLPW
ncbi:MAG: hypothetical protein KAW92_01465 [Candidatus Cloacimonetes bacterium]|nr:hypothetical protein [Candidatus Cloacimonadota bacterium]